MSKTFSPEDVLFQSTHPVGGGTTVGHQGLVDALFQSTHPVGGGTHEGWIFARGFWISIHPPRGGWDLMRLRRYPHERYFNPPTPWGVGQVRFQRIRSPGQFQSTHPVGGGTVR